MGTISNVSIVSLPTVNLNQDELSSTKIPDVNSWCEPYPKETLKGPAIESSI